MKTPKTIDEVKKHFKNVKEIRCVYNKGIFDISRPERKIHRFNFGLWVDLEEQSVKLYDERKDELAEIISYKSTKEKTPKKELKALLSLAKECLEQSDSIVCKEYKGKILDACPSLKVESDVLEVGQWYNFDYGLFFITNFTNSYEVKGYGFHDNEWEDNRNKYSFMGLKTDDDWQKADPKKVEELLIAEAKKRGFKKGVYVNKSCFKDVPLMTVGFSDNSLINSDYFQYFPNDNVLQLNSNSIFYNGTWATINEVISLSEAERRLNLKIKID